VIGLAGCASAPRESVTYPYARPDFVKESDWQRCDGRAHGYASRTYNQHMAGLEGGGGLIGAAVVQSQGGLAAQEPRYRQYRDDAYEDEMKRCLQSKGYPVVPKQPVASFTK
jgi:hypothetical protein